MKSLTRCFLRKKIAFIDHSFHQKTRSSDFFLECLKDRYDVDVYYDTYWRDRVRLGVERLNAQKYDTVIFWQAHYDTAWLQRLECRNIVYIPMYDEVVLNTVTPFYWKQFSGVKFVSFSKTLHAYLQSKGLDSCAIRYFPEPIRPKENADPRPLTAFFWYRVEAIGWETVKNLLGTYRFKTFYIRNHPDPNQKAMEISQEDIERYNIVFVDWFDTHEEYLRLLRSVDVYFAPRQYEGIGLTFLEAMRYGIFVVAPDKPTMNEYIVHGKNGFLYGKDDQLAFERFDTDAVYALHQKYYEAYRGNIEELFTYIEMPLHRDTGIAVYLFRRLDSITKPFFRVWRKLVRSSSPL
jgi:glycosyltransferase involved in cell wall biosynthesis